MLTLWEKEKTNQKVQQTRSLFLFRFSSPPHPPPPPLGKQSLRYGFDLALDEGVSGFQRVAHGRLGGHLEQVMKMINIFRPGRLIPSADGRAEAQWPTVHMLCGLTVALHRKASIQRQLCETHSHIMQTPTS